MFDYRGYMNVTVVGNLNDGVAQMCVFRKRGTPLFIGGRRAPPEKGGGNLNHTLNNSGKMGGST